tara:strand:- start:2421 stop:3071 length:651 start_codon:yes stop_codon:yes gene_type:complete
MSETIWETLSGIDVSEHTEKKGNLTYLSWAWAWGIVKKHYPNAVFQKHLYDTTNGTYPYMKDDQGFAFVSVTVKIGDDEQTELLPVLDFKNKAMKHPDSFSVNTAIQRCLAKCCAMHGLGHYIYAGEDLPEGVEPQPETIQLENKNGEKKTVEDYSLVGEVFKTFIPECNDITELRGFWAKNKKAIDLLETKDKALYDDVFKDFIAHKETLEGKAA